MRHNSIWPQAAAEGIGTFAIVFFGCGAIRLGLAPGTVSVVFGLTVAVMIYALGHLSGAHFNPAVTLAFAAVKKFPYRHVGGYWLSQLTGSFLAASLLAVLIPNSNVLGAVTTHLTPGRTFVLEAILTFFLMLVIIAVATDSMAEGTMAGAAIGGMVTIGSFVGGPLTGAAMNPARYLAPAVLEGKLDFWWIYLTGAFTGATLGAILYEKIRRKEPSSKKAR